MSFFDEEEEPRTTPRTTPRRRRPSGGGRRPPSNRQEIQVRRAVALVALVIVIVLIVLGVHSCQSSAHISSLKDYSDNVAALNQQSVQTGRGFFSLLSSGATSNPTSLQNQINQARVEADGELSHAGSIDVPDDVKGAQQKFVLALQMRRDAMFNIAQDIQPALAPSARTDAINAIAAEMARFYASDVLYKDYTLPQIVSALKAAGIAVGGANGQQLNSSQFLPDVQWLTPDYIAGQLRVSLPTPTTKKKAAPGIHGHAMQSCSVGGNTLSTGSTNTLSASPPPTFTCIFTNDGQHVETNVAVTVTVGGTSVSGQTVVPQTTPGQQATAQVTLSSSPPPGMYTVTAMVGHVPGETVFTHNALSFPVTFH